MVQMEKKRERTMETRSVLWFIDMVIVAAELKFQPVNIHKSLIITMGHTT